MVEAFEHLVLYKAASIANNLPAQSSDKIETDGDKIQLQYCIPFNFSKRQTDLTAPNSSDPTKPDTGTAMNVVEIMLLIDRSVSTLNPSVLERLMKWFYVKAEDATFKRGFLGLENDDNPELNLHPIGLAGYRIIQYGQVPDTEHAAIQQFFIRLEFQGDHTQLGAFQ